MDIKQKRNNRDNCFELDIMLKQNNNTKCCANCRTTKTPLWRGGPAGPKSLCNACGIRHRKRKRAIEGMSRRRSAEKKKDKTAISGGGGATSTEATVTNAAKSASGKVDSSNTNNGSYVNGFNGSFKLRLMALGLGKEVHFQRPSLSPVPVVVMKKQRCRRRRKLKEEEQAAFSLMALSCGVVFA